MPAALPFDYAVVRVVPRVERGELVNVGVIVSCTARAYVGCRWHLPAERLRALDPRLDLEAVRRHLEAFAAVCRGDADAGPLARLSPSERFHWLVAPRSTIVQTSPVHVGLCAEPAEALDHLFTSLAA